MRGLERFVCFLYGHPRQESVNEARRKVFWQKFNKDEKIIDLSLMPPCESNLHHHIMRSNYVAYLFRRADRLMMHLEKSDRHGWDTEGKVVWSDICYPDDINELLLDEESEIIVFALTVRNTKMIWMSRSKMSVTFEQQNQKLTPCILKLWLNICLCSIQCNDQ